MRLFAPSVDPRSPAAWAALEELARSSDLGDRAIAASELRRQSGEDRQPEVDRLYGVVRETALREHRVVRGALEFGPASRHLLGERASQVPLELRDHLIEEILDVAYAPLETGGASSELILDAPSRMAEILFAIDRGEPGPRRAFVDLGSGGGKVVLLVALLTGARAIGIERDGRLVAHAQRAARALGLTSASFVEGDLTRDPLPEGDIYYMFIPSVRSADIVARLAPAASARKIVLVSQALDLRRFPWLTPCGAFSYCLEMYASAPPV